MRVFLVIAGAPSPLKECAHFMMKVVRERVLGLLEAKSCNIITDPTYLESTHQAATTSAYDDDDDGSDANAICSCSIVSSHYVHSGGT